MPRTFYLTGILVPSNTERSFRLFTLNDNGNKVFIGLVNRKALSALLQKITLQADICQFSQTGTHDCLEL